MRPLTALVAGASALAIELVWIRILSLAFGSASVAAGAVVASLMLGMALGSAWAGRPSGQPLRLLGGALLALAAAAVLSAPFIRAVGAWGTTGGILAGLFMAGASVPMGMAVPLLAAGSGRAGSFYALNTLGSALATLGTGFLLLPALGNQKTLWVAALPLVAVGLVLARTPRAAGTALPSPSPPQESRPCLSVLLAYGGAAFAAMVTEIGWMRALVLSIGSSTYAYTLVLGLYIAGLGLGSAWGTRLFARSRSPSSLFGGVQLAVALLSLGTLHLLGRLPALLGGALFQSVNSLGSFVALSLLAAGPAILPPTLAVGAGFPVAVLWAGSSRAGALLAAATAGSMLGALAGSFVAIPALGLERTLGAALLLHALLGSAVLTFGGGRRRLWPGLAAGAILAFLVLGPRWDARVIQSGPAINEPYPSARGAPDPRKVLFARDDRVASVAVFELPGGNRILRIDGKTDASMTQIDQVTQLLTAHIPMSIHGHADRVAVIGLGSGMTVASCLRYEPGEIRAIEISPAVVRASHFFDDYTGNPLGRQDRVKLDLEDARAVMARPGPPFDVIINEPSNLWIAGMAGLFTEEFYRSCAVRLSERGLMCQWIHAYGVTERVFRDAVATFLRVFPHTTLWEIVVSGDYLLLGSQKPYAIEAAQIARELDRPQIREDLRWIDVRTAAGILGDLVAGPEDLAGFAAGARVQTDDGLHLEFQAPLGFYSRRRMPPLDVLPAVNPTILQAVVRGQSVDWSEARTLLREAIKAILEKRDPVDRIRLLERALERYPEERQARLLLDSESEGCVKEADLALAQGRRERFERLIEAVPTGSRWYPAARFRRIGMLRKAGAPPPDLGAEYRKILDAVPGLETAVDPYVDILLVLGAKEEAEQVAREGKERHPKSARMCLARARALLGLGRREDAAAECDQAIELDSSESTRRERRRLLDPEAREKGPK